MLPACYASYWATLCLKDTIARCRQARPFCGVSSGDMPLNRTTGASLDGCLTRAFKSSLSFSLITLIRLLSKNLYILHL